MVYLAPTRIALAQKVFHLKALLNFKHEQDESEKLDLIRRLDTSSSDARSIAETFIPAVIEALTQGRFNLAFDAFTNHQSYLEQDPVCNEIAKQLSLLLQFFQSDASDPHVTNKAVFSSHDTINQMQTFLQVLNQRQAKF